MRFSHFKLPRSKSALLVSIMVMKCSLSVPPLSAAPLAITQSATSSPQDRPQSISKDAQSLIQKIDLVMVTFVIVVSSPSPVRTDSLYWGH